MTRALFVMEGPAFKVGMPLHVMTDSLDALQGIMDKAYLVPQKRERISGEDRKAFYIRSYIIEHGSLIADLEIVVDVVAPLLPIITTLSPDQIWTYTKSTFDFLKLIFKALKKGESIRYEFKGDDTVVVHAGNVTNNYYGPVFNIGRAAVPSYKKITEQLGRDSVHSVELYREKDKDHDIAFGLNLEDKDLFDIDPHEEEEIIEIKCEIYDFNKYENKGRLNVLPNQSIPEGRYSFSALGKQDNVDYIQSMLRPTVNLRCKKEIKGDPFVETIITRLLVIEIIDSS